MKWITTKIPPTEGDVRIKRKFAFTPVIAEEYTVWLETYDSVQEYTKVWDGDMGWEMRWVEQRKKPLFYMY